MLSTKKSIVRQYCDAVGRGDIEAYRSFVTEDFTHEFLGSTVLAGKRSLPEAIERVQGFSAALAGDAKFVFQEMVEEGDLVAGFFTGECELADGRRFDGDYALICRFKGDRIQSTRELLDTKLADTLLGDG